jgi:hypothetical protein
MNHKARIEQLEHHVRFLADALMFTMTNIQQVIPSPIAGAPGKTVSLADYYKVTRQRQSTEPSTEPEETPGPAVPRVTLQ